VRDVSEIAQLRVVLDPGAPPAGAAPPLHADAAAEGRQLCYHVMGLVHARWAPVPGSMKDYIATPKPNNYQSLHTSVVPTGLAFAGSEYADYSDAVSAAYGNGNGNGSSANGSNGSRNGAAGGGNGGGDEGGRPRVRGPGVFPIEIQIRTEAMDRLARYGIAVDSWSCADYSSPQGPLGERQLRAGGADAHAANGGGANGSGVPFPYGVVPGLRSLGSSAEDSSEGEGSGGDGGPAAPAAAAAQGGGGGAKPAASARLDPQTMSRRINWLNSIRQWQQEFVGTLTASEFVACITDDLLGQGVFVFTPSGQVMRLPRGATAVDFAYHIHTDVGNTMVAARVNGKVVGVEHELSNAEVVEVITYKGPVNAAHIRRHQRWLGAARTKTARHKLAKFLREHAALAAAQGLGAPPDSALGRAAAGGAPGGAPQAVWLLVRCDDRQGLLADISNVIARHAHNIRSYSGSSDREAAAFVMEYELEGDPDALCALCTQLGGVPSVQGWAAGCAMPSAADPRRRRYEA
jgi:hypothetical protein